MELYDPPSAAVIVISTTAISGGTDTRVLFDDGGKIGESSGLTYTKATGLLKSTVMAIGGATIGTDALAVTGTTTLGGTITGSFGGTSTVLMGVNTNFTTFNAISLNGSLADAGLIGLVGGGGSSSLFIQSLGTTTFRNAGSSIASVGPTGLITGLSLATAAPAGSSVAAWKLGALQTAAVVLDTTRSLYVDVGGTVYHVLVST